MPRRLGGGVIGSPNLPTSTAGPGVWALTAAAVRNTASSKVAGGYWPGYADASYSSVSVLIHCRTSVTVSSHVEYPDTSNKGHNAQSTSTSAAGYGLSASQTLLNQQYSFFNGNAAGLSINGGTGTDFAYGTGDFTIEFWMYPGAVASTVNLLDQRSSAAAQIVPTIYMIGTNIRYFVNGADRISGGTAVTANAWHHVAVSKVSGSTYLYLDGTQQGSTYTDGNNYVTNGLIWGAGFSAGSPMQTGYLSDLRITKGVGRYSGTSLTVPTEPFSDY